ncbi:MAG: GvpL/GvpF family gas vesicle protein [Gemmatimonadota bacterium]
MADFIYLYGFVPGDAVQPSNLAGVGGATVSLINVGPVKAVVNRVPAEIYDPARIDERLQDLSWVAQQGVAHETVVAWFVDNAEILPVSLFTMYSSDNALRAALAPRAPHLHAELLRLNNKREWDLKISFNEHEVERNAGALSPIIAELDREAAAATPGKRYLLEKKRADMLKVEVRHAAQSLAHETLDAARAIVAEARTLPIPQTAEDLPVILHAALLVDRAAEQEMMRLLETEVGRLGARGVTLRFSGPWAPYRFTGDDEPAASGPQ